MAKSDMGCDGLKPRRAKALHLRMLNTVERALQKKHAIKINGTASDAKYLGT